MKVVTMFASSILGANPDESLKTKLTTIIVNPQDNNIKFGLSILLSSEKDNDEASILVFLKSPKGHWSSIPYKQKVIGEKSGEHIALGFYTEMPFVSEGAGNYHCIIEINGRLDKEELLFELKFQEATIPPPLQHA